MESEIKLNIIRLEAKIKLLETKNKKESKPFIESYKKMIVKYNIILKQQ